MALSISRALAAERAFNLACPDGNEESGLTIPEVELMINDAARMLCDRIRESKAYYRLHDPAISVNIAAGMGSLPEDVMAESIADAAGGRVEFTRIDITNPTMRSPVKWLPDLAKLKRARPGGNKIGYYTIYGSNDAGRLFIYSALGVACVGTATVTAARYYTFETMPAQLEDEFVRMLADMAQGRLLSKGTMNADADNPSAS